MKHSASILSALLRKERQRVYELTSQLRSMLDCEEHFDYQIVPTGTDFKPDEGSVMICGLCVKRAKEVLHVPQDHTNFTELGYFFSQGGKIKKIS